MAKRLNINVIGVESIQEVNVSYDLFFRIKSKTESNRILPQLVISEDISKVDSDTDILVIDDFKRVRYDIIKGKVRPNLGFEVFISNARKLNSRELGKWMVQAKSLHTLCVSAGSQFIISSGARSIFEMVSARTFESVLKILGISPVSYWKNLSQWLSSKDSIKVL